MIITAVLLVMLALWLVFALDVPQERWPLLHRRYRTGTRWGVWLWTDVTSDYIRRLHVVKTPWFAICLHWLRKPDPEPWHHDHPVTFLSLVLRGGYSEVRVRGEQVWAPTHHWWNFIRATDKHTIVSVRPSTVTLCLMGPKVREWGYHTDKGWVYWRDYERARKAAPPHNEHGFSTDSDCPCRATTQQHECAGTGCGFCVAAEHRAAERV